MIRKTCGMPLQITMDLEEPAIPQAEQHHAEDRERSQRMRLAVAPLLVVNIVLNCRHAGPVARWSFTARDGQPGGRGPVCPRVGGNGFHFSSSPRLIPSSLADWRMTS